MNNKDAEIRIKRVLKKWSDDKTHNMFTPFELCDVMLDKLPNLNKDQNILVMFNLEFLWKIKERIHKLDKVWFFTPCDTKEKVGIAIGIKENHIVKYSYNTKQITNDEMPKFDIVVGNPPYKHGLHLRFLKMALDMSSSHVVFIEPGQWLIVEGKTNFTNIEKELAGIFNHNEVDIEIVNGRKYFHIALGLLTIHHINLNGINSIKIDDQVFTNTVYDISNVDEISKFGISKLYKKLKSKIIDNIKNENILNYVNKETPGKFIVNVPRVRGHIEEKDFSKLYMDDFYTLLPKKYIKPDNFIDERKDRWFIFETEKEAINFIKFLKTYYVRFCLAIRKNNIATFQTSECNLIPWLDFSKEWTDEKLYEHFNLTFKEIQFIEKNIPAYYD